MNTSINYNRTVINIIGSIIILSGWILESVVHTIFLGETFLDSLFYPDAHEFWSRLNAILTSLVLLWVVNIFFGKIKKSEEVIYEKDSQFKALFESSKDAIGISKNGIHLFANPAYLKLFGYENNEQLRGIPVLSNIAPSYRSKIVKNIQDRANRKGIDSSYETRGLKTDGTEFDFEVNVSTYELHGEIFTFASIRDITERKNIETEILKLSKAVDHSPVSIIITDVSGDIEYVNPKFCELTGYTIEEVIGKKPAIVQSGTTSPEYYKNLWDTILSGKQWRGELLNKKKNGEFYWEQVSISPIFDDNGKITHFIAIKEDITEKKMSAEALSNSEKRFRVLFEQAAVGVAQIETATGRFIHINQKYCDLIGYSLAEMQRMDFHNISHPEELKIDLYNMERIKAGEIDEFSMEKRLYKKDGNTVWVNLTVSPMWTKGTVPDYHVAIVQDITERKRAEAEILKLTKAVEHSPVSIIITNLDGNIEYVNQKFCELTGYSKEEIIGKNPSIIQSGETPTENYKNLWDTIISGEEWHDELHNKKKNGELYWEFAHISPIFDSNGKTTHFIAIKEDISERKRTENELQEIYEELRLSNQMIQESLYEKNMLVEELFVSESKLKETVATKDTFFSIIAHDLRGPFSGFLGLTELMSKETVALSPEDIKKMAYAMNKSANSLYQLLDDLLQWASSQTGNISFERKEVDLSAIAFNSVNNLIQMAKNKNITLIQNIQSPAFVDCDSDMITTVIRNLVSNAIKFTPENGSITVNMNDNADYSVISVKDTGVGISKGTLEKLFKIDSKITSVGTNNEKGIGLGLILCKEFVEKHGGKIWVESEVGNGSTFYFSLPKLV